MIWAEMFRMSLINIQLIRIHLCPWKLGGMIFAGCSFSEADRYVAADLRIVGRAGFQRPSAGHTVGAAEGGNTNPVPCWMSIAVEGGSAR